MGNAMTPEFKALLDKACLHRTARRLADNHRSYDVMSEREEVEELSARYVNSLIGFREQEARSNFLAYESIRFPGQACQEEICHTRVANLLGWAITSRTSG